MSAEPTGSSEPMLVSSVRRWVTRSRRVEVIGVCVGSRAKIGTTGATFLREYDAAVRAARREAWAEGQAAQAAAQPGALVPNPYPPA